MNEAETCCPVGIHGEQAVAFEVAFSFLQRGRKILRGIVLMVQMDFRLTGGGVTKVCEVGEYFVVVLFDGIKKSVPKPLPARIPAGGGYRGVIFLPALDAGQRLRARGLVKRFKMVAHAEHQMCLLKGDRTTVPHAQVGWQPAMQGFEHLQSNMRDYFCRCQPGARL